MGRRILALLLTTIAIVVSPSVFALGLGEITLKSSLNQPLNAEIQLLQARDLTGSEILVGLASPEDFERVGVDRPYFLTNLKFKVELNGPNGPVILVTSQKQVREPFVNFVLQAQWPSGRLLREYTLLMDLPVFSDQQAAPVTGAQSQQVQQQNTIALGASPAADKRKPSNYNPRSNFDEAPSRPSVTQQSTASSYQGSASAESYADDSYGPVKANDTLWEIASRVRPDRAVSIQQTMLAIQRLNPEAFINNNINLLRKGQILRVPDREQIVEYSKRQAVSEVAVQNSQWTGGSESRSEVAGAQLEGSKSISSYEESPEEVAGRVSLSSPEDVTGTSGGRGAGAGSSSLDALENELAITLEHLDKSSRDNTELKSRIESLEEQIATMERMIEISSEDMRALELAAEKNRQREELAAIEEASAESFTGDSGDEGDEGDEGFSTEDEVVSDLEQSGDEAFTLSNEFESESVVGEDLDLTEAEAVDSIDEPTAEPTAQPKPTVIAAPKPIEKSIVDHLLDNIIFVAGGLLALLIAGYLFIRFRSSDDEFSEETDDFLADTEFEEYNQEEVVEEEDIDLGLDEEESIEADLEDDIVEEDLGGEAQTEDAVAEADIYIAYGKYDQAEEMLLNALETDPADAGARVKLLEVYAAQQDIHKFDPHYAKLRILEDDQFNARGEQLRESIAGAELFDESLFDVSADAAVHLGDQGVDSSLSDLDSQLENESVGDFDELTLDLQDAEAVDSELDDGLDFELNLDNDVESDSADDALDFDLDLDGSDEQTLGAEGSSGGFDLELDSEFEGDDDLAALELDVVESADADGELSADDFDLDFDLGTDVEEPSLDEGDLETLDLDVPFAEDDALGLGDSNSPDLDFDSGAAVDGETDNEELAGLDDDLLAMDLDVGLGDTELESLELTDTTDDFEGLSLEDEFSLSDGESLVEDLAEENLELDAPVNLTDQLDVQDTSMEDLSLTGELDLSALDQELDALTSDLGVEEADIDSLELAEPPEGGLAASTGLESPTVMEEPVTDFEDFEDELTADLSGTDEGLDDLELELEPAESVDEALADTSDDSLFAQALAGVPQSDLEFTIPEVDPEGDDDDLGFLSDSDETATKLDLARAYIDMEDADGAKDILEEIIKEGNPQQKQEAENLLSRV